MKAYGAIECIQNGKSFFITSVNSSILKNICYISRREEDPEKGFQRLLNLGRAKNIANYLDKEKGVIPSAVILSAQPGANFTYNKKTKTISFDVEKDGFLIIDGQHRLYGLYEAKKDYDIPVIVFDNLNTAEEVSLFIDINTTQKGVSSALLLDIKSLAAKETKVEEKQRELFELLDKDSPLSGLLSKSKSVVGKISRSAFNEATKQIFENGPLSREDINIIYKAVKNYLIAVEIIFNTTGSKEARLNKSTVFKSIFAIFNDVCSTTLQEYNNLQVKSISEVIESISVLDYDQYIGTSKAVIVKITNDMKSALLKRISVSEDMF